MLRKLCEENEESVAMKRESIRRCQNKRLKKLGDRSDDYVLDEKEKTRTIYYPEHSGAKSPIER